MTKGNEALRSRLVETLGVGAAGGIEEAEREYRASASGLKAALLGGKRQRKIPVLAHIDPDAHAWLERIARETGSSMSAVLNQLALQAAGAD